MLKGTVGARKLGLIVHITMEGRTKPSTNPAGIIRLTNDEKVVFNISRNYRMKTFRQTN